MNDLLALLGCNIVHMRALVQILDSYDWLGAYRDAFESQCMDATMWAANATTMEELEASAMYRAVADVMCPGNCSARGRCERGLCVCEEGQWDYTPLSSQAITRFTPYTLLTLLNLSLDSCAIRNTVWDSKNSVCLCFNAKDTEV